MTIRRLLVPLTLAIVSLHAGQAGAQGSFPAPLPGQAPSNASPFPPVNGAAPSGAIGAPSSSFPASGAAPITGSSFARPAAPQGGGSPDQCMKAFMPLREEAEKRGKLISNFGQAESKMIKYVETHAADCGIPPQIGDQLKAGHKNTEALQKKVCAVAQQVQTRGPAGPSLSEVLGSAASVPEATASRKGGSTFDTLNGNVLAR